MYSYIAMNTSVIITVRNQMHITWFFGIATFGLSSSSDELLQAEVDESSSSLKRYLYVILPSSQLITDH